MGYIIEIKDVLLYLLTVFMFIPFILEVADALAALVHSNHMGINEIATFLHLQLSWVY